MSSLFDFTDGGAWNEPYRVVECKRALSPSGLPGIDYALNPYGGCAHGCVYCYAPEVTHSEWKEWRVVRVRANIVDRLGKELEFIDRSGVVGIGTTTDPYQYAEGRFCLTGQCLEVLRDSKVSVHIHTKSDLVLRDVELISGMRSVVGITVTGVDDRYSKMTEPGAPMPALRLKALKELTEAGISTYALVEPVMSTVEGHEKELVDAVADTGTGLMLIGPLNERPLLAGRVSRMGIRSSPVAVERIRGLAAARGITVRDVF
jgi:DNA repair photolyase